jgi:hypothetical protein
MLVHWENATTSTTNMTGIADAGLICTGQGEANGGSRFILRSFGVYAASALTTVALRLYDDAGTPLLMATIVNESSVTSYYEDGMNVVVPPGWTLEVHTTGASQGCTAWAEYEVGGAV